jgi:hemerythrin-like metal-binding protein
MTPLSDQIDGSLPDGRSLSPGLITGNEFVDREHHRLCELIDDLRTVCGSYHLKSSCEGCSDIKIETCEARYLDCVGGLIDFMCEHFSSEERLMKERGIAASQRERYLSHIEDHASLSDHALGLLKKKDRQLTVQQIAEMASVVRSWIDGHIETYDVPMIR